MSSNMRYRASKRSSRATRSAADSFSASERKEPSEAGQMLGLLADLIADAPLGGGVLVLLLVLGVTRWARRRLVRQSFLAVWLAFSAIAALAALLGWTLAALLSLTFLPIAPALIEAGLAIGFYPALATLLSRAHRGLAAPERA